MKEWRFHLVRWGRMWERQVWDGSQESGLGFRSETSVRHPSKAVKEKLNMGLEFRGEVWTGDDNVGSHWHTWITYGNETECECRWRKEQGWRPSSEPFRGSDAGEMRKNQFRDQRKKWCKPPGVPGTACNPNVPAVPSFSFLLPYDNGLSPDLSFLSGLSWWGFPYPRFSCWWVSSFYIFNSWECFLSLKSLFYFLLLLYFLQSLPETPIVEINVLHLANCIFFHYLSI